MKIGFTGTRRGMTHAQTQSLRTLLKSFQKDSLAFEVHHGDCVGADDQFVGVACEVYRCLVHVVCHPPVDGTHRANNPKHDEMREAKTHFARNRQIVEESQVVIACPAEMERQKYGGTWYTYDYSLKMGRKTYLIYPDGNVFCSG